MFKSSNLRRRAMTHPAHPSVLRDVVQLLAEHGFDGMAQAMQPLKTSA
jgi:hypothetical protein